MTTVASAPGVAERRAIAAVRTASSGVVALDELEERAVLAARPLLPIEEHEAVLVELADQ